MNWVIGSFVCKTSRKKSISRRVLFSIWLESLGGMKSECDTIPEMTGSCVAVNHRIQNWNPLCQSSLKFLNENLLLARYVWCDFRANEKQGSLNINFYVLLLSKSKSESNRALLQFFSINDHLRSWRNLPHDQQRHHWTLQVCQLYKNFKIIHT